MTESPTLQTWPGRWPRTSTWSPDSADTGLTTARLPAVVVICEEVDEEGSGFDSRKRTHIRPMKQILIQVRSPLINRPTFFIVMTVLKATVHKLQLKGITESSLKGDNIDKTTVEVEMLLKIL